MLIETLRKELKEIFKGKSFNGIDTDFDKYLIKNDIGFFPYGSGLITTKREIQENCFLILGSDFGSTFYAKGIIEKGEEKNQTYRNLKKIINDENKERVFLSNVFMGLREGETSNIKDFPAFENEQYKQSCKVFLELQIARLKPYRIITLGQRPENFIRQNLNIKTFNIPHPYSWFNLKRSKGFNNREDIKSYIFDYLAKKYKMNSWYSFDDDIFYAAKNFHEEKRIFANMVIMNEHSYSQINFLTSISPKREVIVDDNGESEIEIGRFSYRDCSLAVATYTGKLSNYLEDMEFELIYDSDYGGDEDNVNDKVPPVDLKKGKQPII